MLKQSNRSRRQFIISTSRKVSKQLNLYSFPAIQGLEDITLKLNGQPAQDLFGALCHVVPLIPIESEKNALLAERMIEYLNRLDEGNASPEIKSYEHLLQFLLDEYEAKIINSDPKKIPPHEFLKALLKEDNIPQKNLVPDYFPTESQISEFLNQKKSRNELSYQQAVKLGKRFSVDPINFLE